MFADAALARRLEQAEAGNDAACTPAGIGAAVERIGGGVAVFAGAGSPLTRAIGLGLSGRAGDAEVEAVERFFHNRGAAAGIELCPLADPGLAEALRRRGYVIAEFNNVLARDLRGAAPYPADPRARRVLDNEHEMWALTVGRGFFEADDLAEEEMEIGRAISRLRGADCYLGFAASGEPAAGAALSFHDGLALLFADGTIPWFRRAGLHAALIQARLNAALARGCDLATASVAPGGGSQRNYERLGFRVAYTKALMTERPGHPHTRV